MTSSLHVEPVPGLSAWWERHATAGAGLALPFDRAVAGGFAADRLGYAFASGYHEALRHLVPDLGTIPAALCATEDGGAHPKAIRTTLSGGRLNGAKSFVTLGDEAALLLVVASIGTDESGRNRLVVVRLPADRPGVVREPAPAVPFIPEVGHARLRLTDVEVPPDEVLPGDGYEDVLKPFRTIEDCHVHGALLGYLVQVGRHAGWPRTLVQELLHHLAALRDLAAAPPLAPGAHLALGGFFQSLGRLLDEVAPLWRSTSPDEQSRWERDRPLLGVAGTARAARLQAAWRAVGDDAAGAVTSSPPARIVPVREGYDRWAAIYDEEDNALVRLEERHLPPLLDVAELRGRAVLDVGCGTGRHAVRLAQAGADVTAVDISEGMLARARAKAGALPVRFLVHDLTQPLPLPDATFDLVLSCLVLEHIADVDAFLAELARVCRPGGAVVLSAMHPAMMLRGVSARFIDPETRARTCPQSHPQQLADYVMAALRAGLTLTHLGEHAVDDALIAASPRAARYRGWPMLALLRLRRAVR